MSELITTDLVVLDANFGQSKDDVIRGLVALVAADGRSDDADGLAADVFAREAKTSTGMPGGLAIPHCRSEHVTEPTLAFARLDPKVDFGAKDGPADLVFMINAPAEGDQLHMKLLTQLARALVRKEFTDALRTAATPEEVVELVREVVQPPAQPAAESAPAASAPKPSSSEPTRPAQSASAAPDAEPMTIVAVTACPTGIAHTFMAAEALEAAGKKAGVNLVVEPQGSVGAERLDLQTIKDARAVIFATDVGVRDKGRFAGLPEIATSVKNGIHEADGLVARAVAAADDPKALRVSADGADDTGATSGGGGEGWGTRLKTAILTGVSYMIPFVAAGGLLIALGFLLGGYEVAAGEYGDANQNLADFVLSSHSITNLPDGALSPHALFGSGFFLYIGAALFKLGGLAFAFLVPALAGYIAYALADRPGIAPGFTAGAVAVFTGAGFLGGLVGGILAGFVAAWISRWKVPAFARGLMPVVVIPLLATFISGGIMLIVLGRPLALVTSSLENALAGMSGTSAVALGAILGLMMCFDMGGPVNKAAYAFATAGLNVEQPATMRIMAAVMLAGMVPPLALALATAVRPKLFTPAERENGKAAWLLGASFISEGAIPFAAADPLRVIPPIMLGGAVTGALSMAGGVELGAPHGGVFVIFAVSGIGWFFLSLVVGTVIAGIAVIVAKSMGRSEAGERELAPAVAK
ncbi:PTS transporter subunit EIIA [Epidermidibacterium keratini]|uniref:PTS transporter subunit EIIA n=1 Tax=Epidermidibacterium keratini TaxID=1891644 RepID=A0A7L4YPW4_9ACTN|nr:fructose-specific PTS transporter subunit EIIC [Epidermidibacterium keratini]QHC01321.1 PTS transporter subunit EIIA [Epidermidibacterium keratini]